MSRKSRQKKGRTLLQKAFPTWLAASLLILALGMGILCMTLPWSSQPTPYEDTIPVSATITEVEGDYRYRRNHRSLERIYLYFEDHERLMFDPVLAHDALLEKLESSPAGTVFDMRLEPNGMDVMALSVDGAEVFSYEAACRAIQANNVLGIVWGIFSLAMGTYAAWSLFIRWKYRRLT